MKNPLSHLALLCVSVAVATTACRQKADSSSTELEKALTAMGSAAPAPAPAAAPEAPPGPAPAVELKQAMDALKIGKLEDTVTHLQSARASSAMTGQQRIALNDAMAAVMNDIYARAAKGDVGAKKAVKRYEQLQTQPR